MDGHKICNICEMDKALSDFRVNARRCKACQNQINKAYSKQYYQQHKDRLKDVILNRYHEKASHSKPVGRPRKPEYYLNGEVTEPNNI